MESLRPWDAHGAHELTKRLAITTPSQGVCPSLASWLSICKFSWTLWCDSPKPRAQDPLERLCDLLAKLSFHLPHFLKENMEANGAGRLCSLRQLLTSPHLLQSRGLLPFCLSYEQKEKLFLMPLVSAFPDTWYSLIILLGISWLPYFVHVLLLENTVNSGKDFFGHWLLPFLSQCNRFWLCSSNLVFF